MPGLTEEVYRSGGGAQDEAGLGNGGRPNFRSSSGVHERRYVRLDTVSPLGLAEDSIREKAPRMRDLFPAERSAVPSYRQLVVFGLGAIHIQRTGTSPL